MNGPGPNLIRSMSRVAVLPAVILCGLCVTGNSGLPYEPIWAATTLFASVMLAVISLPGPRVASTSRLPAPASAIAPSTPPATLDEGTRNLLIMAGAAVALASVIVGAAFWGASRTKPAPVYVAPPPSIYHQAMEADRERQALRQVIAEGVRKGLRDAERLDGLGSDSRAIEDAVADGVSRGLRKP